MSNITFDMPIDRTVTVITDGRNITNIVFDMNIPDRPDPICEKAKEQFLAYFDGGLKEFSLPYDISGIGTPFFRSILTAVQKIPYGERVTYRQAAEMCVRFGAEKKSAPDSDTVSKDSPCKRRHRLLYGYAGDRYKEVFT
mgnify:CR=1 FL=1